MICVYMYQTLTGCWATLVAATAVLVQMISVAIKLASVLYSTQLMTCFSPVLATVGSIRIMLEIGPRSYFRNSFKKLKLGSKFVYFSLMFVANNRISFRLTPQYIE